MKAVVIVLLIVGLLFLNKSTKRNKETINEGFTSCDTRKKKNTGSMCKEKWGEPLCNEWKPVQKIEKIKKGVEMIPLRGYQPNSFMYEIDYEKEGEEGGEGEEGEEGEEGGGEGGEGGEGGGGEGEENIPRGVHSSFFP